MSFRNKVKNNTPKVALDTIKSLICGSYKSGKTRLWKEVTERHYQNADEILLLGWEKGYETWEIENILPIHEEGDEYQQWEYFRNVVVKGLVEEAKNGKIVKLIGWDTVDRAIDACAGWIIRTATKKYGKQFSSLQDITEATNDNGYTLLYEELKKQVDALDNAKYGQMFLAWTKEKETTLYNGLKYNSVELMMNNTGKKVFESQSSLICCLFNEVKVYDRDGNELDDNFKDKKGKDKASNFHDTRVVMLFRPNEYVSIAGGRYTDLPEHSIEYSADNFLEVFENAVKGQLKKTNKTVEEIKEEQRKELDQKAKEFAEEQEEQYKVEEAKQTAQELIDAITEEAKRFTGNQIKAQISPKFKELFGTPNYRNETDVEKLQEGLKIIKEATPDASIK